MKKDIDKYKKDIFKAIYSHNEDVCESWEFEKVVDLYSYEDTGLSCELKLSVGNRDKSFFTVCIDGSGWFIEKEVWATAEAKKNLEEVMTKIKSLIPCPNQKP